MTRILAFTPHIVCANRAKVVVAPAYDSMAPTERAAYSEANPSNFIKAMRSQEEYPERARPSPQTVLEHNRAAIQKMLDDGAFELQAQDALYVYRLNVDDHVQTAVVAEVPVAEYQEGRIRRHEQTRSEHENRLTQYLEFVGASSSPVCLAYPDNLAIDELIAPITTDTPLLDFSVEDGVQQTIWQVAETGLIDKLRQQFSKIPSAYLTDGHHRMAASVRHAVSRSQATSSNDGPWNYFLAALFPARQLRILPFNRCVRDLNELSLDALIKGVESHFSVDPFPDSIDAVLPGQRGEFTMLVNDRAYRLKVRSEAVPGDPVGSLDVSVLQSRLLEPLLGVSDARSDLRLDYVTGDSGLDGLRQRLVEGWQVGIACFPTSMKDVMKIADRGLVMPPKSTCFDPKARSGIFLRFS